MRCSHLGPLRLRTVSGGSSLYFLRTAHDRGTTPPPHLELTRRARRAGYGLGFERRVLPSSQGDECRPGVTPLPFAGELPDFSNDGSVWVRLCQASSPPHDKEKPAAAGPGGLLGRRVWVPPL